MATHRSRTYASLAAIALVLVGVTVYLRQSDSGRTEPAGPAQGSSAPANTPAPAPAAPALPAAPAVPAGPRYPVPHTEASKASLADEVLQWVTEPALRRWLNLQDLPTRLVVTVDALGRDHVPQRMWPVQPAAGRFETAASGGATTRIAASNGERYGPYLALMARIPPDIAARAYRSHYAELQRAFEEVGFPGQYFNDRLVQVLDLLGGTAVPDSPRLVHLPEFAGPPPPRPWVMYAFDDPRLEGMSAGQKILFRMNPHDAAKLKDWMAAFRKDVAGP